MVWLASCHEPTIHYPMLDRWTFCIIYVSTKCSLTGAGESSDSWKEWALRHEHIQMREWALLSVERAIILMAWP